MHQEQCRFLSVLGFGSVAVLLFGMALFTLGYCLFIVVWMHAPLLKVVFTAGVLSLIFFCGAFIASREILRVLRGNDERPASNPS